MATLVLSAPQRTTKLGEKSFEATFGTGIAVGYGLYERDIPLLLLPGSTVVLLRKDQNRKRAEGRFVKLVPTGIWISKTVQRYDVHVRDFTLVPYKPERLNRFGVNVI